MGGERKGEERRQTDLCRRCDAHEYLEHGISHRVRDEEGYSGDGVERRRFDDDGSNGDVMVGILVRKDLSDLSAV